MRRVAHPYTDWEGWQAGAYALSDTPIEHTAAARALLSDAVALLEAMQKACEAWPREAEHWLTRPGAKSRSWLGAAACMVTAGAPFLCTRTAWWALSVTQQADANAAADLVRDEWLAAREEGERDV
jgi:uncharacterized membrane protein YdfJ with MMPL/SSD domain